MKTIIARLKVPNHKAGNASASLEKSLHILTQSLKLRNRHRGVYSVTEGEALSLDTNETATVLAALRWYQHSGMGDPYRRPDWLQDIACPDPRSTTSLDDSGIDELCERINFDF